jgi:folate-binding protein YgfZ
MTDPWPSILSQRGALIDAAGDVHFEPSITPGPASLIPLLHEASILVRGEDAESFLQGQLSNDIGRVAAAKGQLAAYCTPKGRVLATFSLWPHDNGYVLRLPAELAGPIQKRLQMFVLRARVVLEDISDQVALLGLAGTQSVPLLREQFGTAPTAPLAVVHSQGVSALALPGHRIEIALNRGSAGALWDRLVSAGCTPAGQEHWDAHAIAAGAATVLAATSDHFIPQMLNLELLGAVAFDKGCYPGQEIVARSQYLGQVKRRLRRFASSHPTHPGKTVHAADGSVAGTVVNIARVPGGEYELLAVILEEATRGPLHLETAPGSSLQPLPLPYEVPQVQPQSATDGD